MVFEFSDGEPTFEKLTLKFARREFALQFKDALDHARALNNAVGSDWHWNRILGGLADLSAICKCC